MKQKGEVMFKSDLHFSSNLLYLELGLHNISLFHPTLAASPLLHFVMIPPWHSLPIQREPPKLLTPMKLHCDFSSTPSNHGAPTVSLIRGPTSPVQTSPGVR